ncbi:hypothetical protein ADUPG1_010708, partial [Aduncisulcus paluster]
SVASLKTLVSVDDGSGVYSPVLSCPSMDITDLTGIEHITEIISFDLSLNRLNPSTSPKCLDSLMYLSNLLSLDLGSNFYISTLPNLTGMSSLTALRMKITLLNLPSETSQDPYLPPSLEELQLYGCDQFDQGAFDAHIGNGLLPNLNYLNIFSADLSSIETLTQTQRDSITTLVISIPDSQNVVPTMHNLETLTIADTTITSIPDLSNSADKLTYLNISNTSVSSLVEAGTLSNLETIKFIDCHVSDLSPLYHLSSLTSVNGIGNKLCIGSAETIETIQEKFVSHDNLTLKLWTNLSDDQTCECSSDDIGYSEDPMAENKVCSETKPWSASWHFVCAGDSYTSYTSAEDFSCTQPDSSTNCSGGCEYGYECRYLGDEEISDVSYSTGECQQVIVDESLHACVADMFVDSDGNAEYEHRTNSTPSLFSVASLRTLVSVEIDIDSYIYSPQVVYTNSSQPISDLAGIEHLVGIKYFNFSSSLSSDITHLNLFSSLTNIVAMTLNNLPSINYLSDLSELIALEYLAINSTSIALPSTEYVLPISIKELYMFSTNTDTDGFDKNVGNGYLLNLEILRIGGMEQEQTITSISSLSHGQREKLNVLRVEELSIGDAFNDVIADMTSLESLFLIECDIITIPDLTKCSSTLKILNVMANPLLSSLTPIASAALTNLTTLNVSGCNISDPSPLYALSNNSWTISLDYNYICGDTDSTKSFIENKFTFANVNLDNQTCVCSDDEYGLNPLSDNLVCSETKPGSGSWYIVCASDSYMSYTYAGEFICTQPDSSTTNCSGGCEYGYECR